MRLVAADHPVCQSANSDADGDGWGWENERSCVVGGSASGQPGVVRHPVCRSAASDPDGDGWGWEQNRSCKVASDPQVGENKRPLQSNTIQHGAKAVSNAHPQCNSAASDPDGDGYGWENSATCVVSSGATIADETREAGAGAQHRQFTLPTCEKWQDGQRSSGLGWENNTSCVAPTGLPVCDSPTADPDADGFGWQNGATCVLAQAKEEAPAKQQHTSASTVTALQVKPSIVEPERSMPQGALGLAAITDVVLVTGQSNVLGSMTAFDERLDQPSQQVFAWTDSGWKIADLHQVWDRNGHPGNFSTTNSARRPYNNFAFHFGKTLASIDPKRVPAIVVTSAPGRGIAHWDRDGAFYSQLRQRVTSALSALPHKHRLDAVLWHQGESDWQYHGTSDRQASGYASTDSVQYREYYALKLASLIADLRSEPWGGVALRFICGETRRATGVNKRLMALNDDGDPRTACVAASDLPARADDSGGSHFSAAGLRELGARYARRYAPLNWALD